MARFRNAALFVLAACSSPARPVPQPAPAPPPVAPSPPTASNLPPATAAALSCDIEPKLSPGFSYNRTDHAVHVKVSSASPGPTTDQSRCVAVEFDVLEAWHGTGWEGKRLSVVLRQSMIERYTSRPADAWWIVEHALQVGDEYIALCYGDDLAKALANECKIFPAKQYLADLKLVREMELADLDDAPMIAKVRAVCGTVQVIATQYLFEKTFRKVGFELPLYEAWLATVTDPSCSPTARSLMFDGAYSIGSTARPSHVRALVRAMFVLLAMPEAKPLHDNLVGTWMPNLLGIEGGMTKQTAAAMFANDAKGRAGAAKALADYKGTSDATKLRAWIR